MYLVVADSVTLPSGWTRSAKFCISVVNQVSGDSTVTRETEHQFSAKETYCGFTSFMPLRQLNHTDKGYLVKDTCFIDVTLSCSSDCKDGDSEPSPDVGVEIRGINDSALTVRCSPSTCTNSRNFIIKDVASLEVSEKIMTAWCNCTSNPLHVSILKRLLLRHGNIFEKMNLQNFHLKLTATEIVANAATILSEHSVKDLSNSDREFLFSTLPYLASFGINVGWLEEKVKLIRGVIELSAAEPVLENIVEERNELQMLLDQKLQKEIEFRVKVDELKAKYGEDNPEINEPMGF